MSFVTVHEKVKVLLSLTHKTKEKLGTATRKYIIANIAEGDLLHQERNQVIKCVGPASRHWLGAPASSHQLCHFPLQGDGIYIMFIFTNIFHEMLP